MTARSTTRMPDKRLLSLATEVSEAKDIYVPRLLLKLENILTSFPQGSLQLQELKQDIYSYQLLQLLLTSIKQDLTKIPQGWSTSSRLAILLSQCCIGFEDANSEEFKNTFLPSVLEQQLLLARKIQSKFIKTSGALQDTKDGILENFRQVLEAISIIYSGHDHITRLYLESPWLFQLLMTDDVCTTVAVLNSFQGVCRMKKDVISELPNKLYQQYLDEFIYKLSSTKSKDIACATVRTVLIICDCNPPTVQLLCIRYRGLRLLLSRWQDKDFDRDLRRLEHLLQAGSLHHANMQSLNKAAGVIQAFWKSHNIRKKLKGADAAMSTFHKSFRAKRELKRLKKEDEWNRKELEHWLLIERKRTMREMRFKQLKAIEILPADQIPNHLRAEQQNAAMLIQRTWKGYRVRAGIDQKRLAVQSIKAAILIQRGVRKWLEKIHSRKKEPRNWQIPPGLTDERRVELLDKITQWRENHEVQIPEAKREDLHERTQGKIKEFCARARQTRKNELHREALLARIATDTNLLLNAPKLSELTSEKDIEAFVCHSVPIATKAAANHKEELRLLHQPWWKKLGDEYQDEKYQEEVEDWRIF